MLPSSHDIRAAIAALAVVVLGLVAGPAAAAQPDRAIFVEPKEEDAEVELPLTLRWTTIEDAVTYYLYIGTSEGLKDLVDTGEIPASTFTVPYLPPNRTLYARILTKRRDGMWLSADVKFKAAGAPVARFLHPVEGAVNLNLNEPYRWTAAVGAQAYTLTVGTKRGGKDLLDTGEIHETSYVGPLLPSGRTVYARIATKQAGGTWAYADVRFTHVRRTVARFQYPVDGATNVDLKRAFTWAAVPGAAAYVLQVGTTAGGNDLLDTGETRATAHKIRSLPSGKVLFARIRTKFEVPEVGLGKGQWGNSDVRFRMDGSVVIPEMIFPRDGATGVDAGRPFQWSAVELARGYRLEIGTRPGTSDLGDSREIAVTRRFFYGLPVGQVLHGRISANVGGRWLSKDFSFSTGASSAPEPYWIESAVWATGQVREMADSGNNAFGWTRLWSVVRGRGFLFAYCSEYATALHLILVDMNIRAQTRTRDVFFDRSNGRDGHTLMEMLQGAGKEWMLLDPTFGLSVKRASDGAWATTEDMSNVARSAKVEDISYEFTSQYGDALLRNYYIEYQKLFLDPSEPRPAGSH